MALRLETFAGLSLSGTTLPPNAHQRRRLALLALLAASGERGITRDKLLALLWPERSETRGRHSLDQLIYACRRSFHASAFVGIDPIALDPRVVESDVAAFRAALAADDLARAVALYRGPFLDGVYLNGMPEFERWVETERSGLSALHAAALNQLATRATARGDLAAAVEHRRRLAAADPLSGRAALALMCAQVAIGDRAGALQFARNHAALVRSQLDCEPDDDVSAYARYLLTSPTPTGTTLTTTPSSVTSAPFVSSPDHQRSSCAGHADPPNDACTDAAVELPFLRGTRPRALSFAAAIAVAAAVASFAAIEVGRRAGRRPADDALPALDSTAIAVLPWRARDDDAAVRSAAERAGDLARAMLSGDGGVRVVTGPAPAVERTGSALAVEDAERVGRATGAGEVLSGKLERQGGQVRLTAVLQFVASRRTRAVQFVTGPIDSLSKLMDELVAGILAAHSGFDAGASRFGARTRSSVAMRALLAGRAAQRDGDEAKAVANFDAALEADSTFLPAAYERAIAPGWLLRYWVEDRAGWRISPLTFGTWTLSSSGDAERWMAALDIAWRGRDRLGDRQRVVLEALRGRDFPRPVDARAALGAWERAVDRAPDVAVAQRNLGLLLLHQGLALGIQNSRARGAAAFRAALERDAGDLAALAGLLEVAALDRDSMMLSELAARYLARDATSARADYVRWRVASLMNRGTASGSVGRIENLRTETLDRVVWASQVSGVALTDADRASAEILRRIAGVVPRRTAIFHAVSLALNRGRSAEALRLQEETRQLMRLREPDPFWERRIESALFADGDSVAALEAVRDIMRAARQPANGARSPFDRQRCAHRAFVLSIWRLAHGDTSGVAAAIASLRRMDASGPLRDEAKILDAQLAFLTRRADATRALAMLDSLVLSGCCQPKWLGLVAARLHERIGDRSGALRMVRAGEWTYAPHFWSKYLREEGRLAALTGDASGAARAYRQYLSLRSAADPQERGELVQVSAALARLEGRF